VPEDNRPVPFVLRVAVEWRDLKRVSDVGQDGVLIYRECALLTGELSSTANGGDVTDIKRVRYEVSMRQVRRGKLALGIANGRVFADDTCVYVAKDMRVGLIASAI
jgi:hypothetical protein